MTRKIRITSIATGQAKVTVGGRTYPATFNKRVRRWDVQTPTGKQRSSSAKLKSIAKLFGSSAPPPLSAAATAARARLLKTAAAAKPSPAAAKVARAAQAKAAKGAATTPLLDAAAAEAHTCE